VDGREIIGGYETLMITVVDSATLGSINQAVTVIPDLTPPTLIVDNLAGDARIIATTDGGFTVKGRTQPGLTASLMNAAAPMRATADDEGRFSLTGTLPQNSDGQIAVSVMGVSGLTASQTLKVEHVSESDFTALELIPAGPLTMTQGDTLALSVLGVKADGSKISLSPDSLTFTATGSATVDAGGVLTVTGTGAGTVIAKLSALRSNTLQISALSGNARPTPTPSGGGSSRPTPTPSGSGGSDGGVRPTPTPSGNGGSGGGSSGPTVPSSGSGGSGGGPSALTIPAANGAVYVNYTQSGGNVTLDLPTGKIKEIINASDDIADFDIFGVPGATDATLPKDALAQFSDAGLGVELKFPQSVVTLEAEAVKAAAKQASGANVTVGIKQISVSDLNARQREVVGSAPVFDIFVKSGNSFITSFGGSLVTIALPYALKPGENALGVVVWYLDENGNIEKIPCMYDARTKMVIFTTDYLSLCAIGYDGKAAGAWQNPFTDIKPGDWFYEDVAFVVANGLFFGTGETTFSPNMPMTRAMLVTVLHRLAGSPAVRVNEAFSDVTEDKWYHEAVNWAAESGIVRGVGNNLFAPDSNVTREQMAAILLNYAKHTGVAPQDAWAVRLDFADAGKISDWATEGAMYCYMNGIINGKPGKLFDPQGEATRAEVAAMLHRFIIAISGNGGTDEAASVPNS
jgi:hypothetical protein